MRKLVFHADGTDMWQWKLPRDDPRQPRLLRIAALLVQDNPFEWDDIFQDRPGTVDQLCYLVRQPEGTVISAEAQGAHGITMAAVQEVGVDIEQAMGAFRRLLADADSVVAFNLNFHKRLVDRAAEEAQVLLRWPALTRCAMMSSADLVRSHLQRNGTWAWPKLSVALQHFVKQDLPVSGFPAIDGSAIVRAVAAIDDGIVAAKGAHYRPAAA